MLNRSGKDLLHEIPVNIGQTIISSLKTKRQFFVIETQQMQNCGVQVMHMNRILGHIKPEIICGTNRNPWLDASASQPHGK